MKKFEDFNLKDTTMAFIEKNHFKLICIHQKTSPVINNHTFILNFY